MPESTAPIQSIDSWLRRAHYFPAVPRASKLTQTPPFDSISGNFERTSSRRYGTITKTQSGRAATNSAGLIIGMSLPGMRRPHFADDASATPEISAQFNPAMASVATARDAAP